MDSNKPFSYLVKKELSQLNNLKNKNLVKFELEGYLLPNSSSQVLTENEYNINRFSKLLMNLGIENFDVEMKGDNFCLIVKDIKSINNKYNILNENSISEEEAKAVFRGTFLRSGSINNPNNVYHLEIIFEDVKKGNFFIDLAKRYNFDFGSSKRNSGLMLYLKSGDSISEFLAFIGCNSSVLNFEDVRMVKEIRNTVNRQVNLEAANMNKTAMSSVKQINDIKYIKQMNCFNKLTEKEKILSDLRLNNPEKTLAELGEMVNPPLSKSGVNHRFVNISKLAEELREEGK